MRRRTKEKLKGLFSKFVILLIVALNIWFTVRVLQVFEATATEPAVLVGSWFLFTGTELVALAKIKVTKTKKEKENEENE